MGEKLTHIDADGRAMVDVSDKPATTETDMDEVRRMIRIATRRRSW